MNIAIFIDSEDVALAISEFLKINNISSKVFYKDDMLDFAIFDMVIVSEDRATYSDAKNKIILTYNSSFADKYGYLLRPFKSSELMKKIKEI